MLNKLKIGLMLLMVITIAGCRVSDNANIPLKLSDTIRENCLPDTVLNDTVEIEIDDFRTTIVWRCSSKPMISNTLKITKAGWETGEF